MNKILAEQGPGHLGYVVAMKREGSPAFEKTFGTMQAQCVFLMESSAEERLSQMDGVQSHFEVKPVIVKFVEERNDVPETYRNNLKVQYEGDFDFLVFAEAIPTEPEIHAFVALNREAENWLWNHTKSFGDSRMLRTILGLTHYAKREEVIPKLREQNIPYWDAHV